MSCQEYLAQYSDYLDARLSPFEAARCRAHAEECASCSRYDRVMRSGLRLVGQLPDIEPSHDFHQRLQHRLYHVQDEAAHGDRISAPGAAMALAIAGLIALAAWSPLLRPGPLGAGAAAPPDPSRAPAKAAIVEPGSAPAWWYGGTQRGVFSYATMNSYSPVAAAPQLVATFPGPYSPLIVSPPVVRGAGAALLARYND